jgi:DNA-binding response OmpR family regulator
MTRPYKALIVEDDKDLTEIFSFALRRAGYETEILYAGDEACSRLDEYVPDLILLDIQLPEVSGADVLEYMRDNPRFEKTRIIVATASPIRIEHLREDADLVLVKPISVNQLSDLAARMRPPE